jgi:hypothetical protein
MTDNQFLAWLKSSVAYRVVLIEAAVQIGGIESVAYMATKPFTTGPSDVPANTTYLPIATVGRLFTERLLLNGEGGLAAGELEIENVGGVRDVWASAGYVWANRAIKAYIGDVRWGRVDFRMIFNGIVADIAPRGRHALALHLRDKSQRLDTAMSEVTLGGATEQRDALLPITLGQTFNVTPLLINAAILKYQIHAGAIHSIIEVRDNGAPVAFTADLAGGTIQLHSAPAGVVTASVRGAAASGYVDTAAQLVKRLLTSYGKTSERFTDADLDLANFAAFDAANQQSVGLYSTARQNVVAACEMLLSSVGGQMVMSRLGLARLIKVALPGAGTPFEIRPEHVHGEISPASRSEPVGAVKLGFAKNWTVQDAGTLANLPEAHKKLFSEEWLPAGKSDPSTIATRRLSAEPVQVDTMLLTRADADAEAQRRLDLWKMPRTTYEFEGVPELLSLELGQAVIVYAPRFGMDSGVAGIVISLAPDWETGRVTVGFLV